MKVFQLFSLAIIQLAHIVAAQYDCANGNATVALNLRAAEAAVAIELFFPFFTKCSARKPEALLPGRMLIL